MQHAHEENMFLVKSLLTEVTHIAYQNTKRYGQENYKYRHKCLGICQSLVLWASAFQRSKSNYTSPDRTLNVICPILDSKHCREIFIWVSSLNIGKSIEVCFGFFICQMKLKESPVMTFNITKNQLCRTRGRTEALCYYSTSNLLDSYGCRM